MKAIVKFMLALLFTSFFNVALAANQDLGVISVGSMKSFSSATAPGSSFLDSIYFNLLSDGSASAGVGSLNYTVAGSSILGIDNLGLSLYDSSDVKLGSGLDFTINLLPAGSYRLEVSGNTIGLQGGFYAGSVRVAPVPEPGVSMMMMAGLLILGLGLYQRKSNV